MRNIAMRQDIKFDMTEGARWMHVLHTYLFVDVCNNTFTYITRPSNKTRARTSHINYTHVEYTPLY